MKRLFVGLLVLVALFVLAMPALAQDVNSIREADSVASGDGIHPPTQEWTRNDVFVIGLLFIAGVAVTFMGVLLVRFGGQLYQSAPPWVGDLVLDTLQRGIDELNRVANETPNQIDDALTDYFDERWARIVEEIRNQPPAPPQV